MTEKSRNEFNRKFLNGDMQENDKNALNEGLRKMGEVTSKIAYISCSKETAADIIDECPGTDVAKALIKDIDGEAQRGFIKVDPAL